MNTQEKILTVSLAERKLRDLLHDLEFNFKIRECSTNLLKKYRNLSEAERFFGDINFALSELSLWLEGLRIDEEAEKRQKEIELIDISKGVELTKEAI